MFIPHDTSNFVAEPLASAGAPMIYFIFLNMALMAQQGISKAET